MRAIGVHATQRFWWVSWINPLADAKRPESREGLSICNTQQCSLTCLDYVTFAMFTFPQTERSVFGGAMHTEAGTQGMIVLVLWVC